MTDRVHSITVVLKEDWRIDEIDNILMAIRMIGPVLSAEPNISEYSDHVANQRVRAEFSSKILDLLKEMRGW